VEKRKQKNLIIMLRSEISNKILLVNVLAATLSLGTAIFTGISAAIVVTFIIGYLLIATEHPLHMNKAIPALFMAGVIWALIAIGFKYGVVNVIDAHHHLLQNGDTGGLSEVIVHHIGKISEILFFLIGAMVIVELIDLHNGFGIVKEWITTKDKTKLLWIIGVLAFFLSAIIDNLTATIVLITILRKLFTHPQTRWWYAGMVIIAANAGGAWSPIGDVTTTMLWIAGKVTVPGLIKMVVVPSLLCFLTPILIASKMKSFKGSISKEVHVDEVQQKILSSRTMLYVGLGMIIFVPIFKSITGLAPFIGMMIAVAVVWLLSEYIQPEHGEFDKKKYATHHALSRIELSSILFFLGILLAVAGLESMVLTGSTIGSLEFAAEHINQAIPNQKVVGVLLGALSALIDNVPLVAAAIGMFTFPIDHLMWHLIAYAAGTGGSMIIIGSAAGVAAMGMEKIPFGWYLKHISLLALIGFLSGAVWFFIIS
jgi:Na+/H+ antiporter NhaD/arsenite permease-like protein